MQRSLTTEEYEKKLTLFKKLGYDFKEVVTASGSRYLIKNKMRFYCNIEGEIPKKELYLFKQVQDEANLFLKNYPDIGQGISSYDVDFMLCNFSHRTTDQVYTNLYEIDINSAYTHAAQKIGIISKKTLKALNKASKTTRLKALGSIATIKTETHYKDGKRQDLETTTTKPTRHLFFLAAQMVTELLKELTRENEDIFFYWVDAIFCKEEAAPKICRAIKKAGFRYKIKGIDKMEVKNDPRNFLVSFQTFYTKGEEENNKPYLFSYRNRIDKFSTLAERERAMFEDFETAAKNGYIPDLVEKAKQVYKTDLADDIPVHKLIRKLNKLGLKAKDYLRIKKRLSATIEAHATDRETGITTKFILFDFIDRMTEEEEPIFLQSRKDRERVPFDTHDVEYITTVKTVETLEDTNDLYIKDEKGKVLF